MSHWQLAWATASLVAATLAARVSLLVVGEKLRLGPRAEAALRYAPACALAALLVPALLYQGDALTWSTANAKLPGALAGAVALLATRSVTACIGVGMATFALWRAYVA
jgi:branched-subunit amino acid transport protein